MIYWKKVLLLFLLSNLSLAFTTLAQNGAQAIVDVAAIPEKAQVGFGDTLGVVIQVQAGKQLVVGATANLEFDPTLFEVVKTIPYRTLETEIVNKVDKSKGRIVYAAGTLQTPIADTFDLIEIRFKVIGKANQSTLHFDTSSNNPEKTDVAYYGATSVLNTTHPATVMIIANNPPVANAGKDIALTDEDNDGKEEVTLDGSASTDSDGTIESYVWKVGDKKIAEVAKPKVNFNAGQTTVTLFVTDDQGATSSDEVVVTINEPSNKAPIANAGEDQTVEDSAGTGQVEVQLDGSASTDNDGTIESYSWSVDGKEIAVDITPKVTLKVGTTLITLTVTDDKGLSSTDDVTIVVNSPDNQPPVANAGEDIDVVDENEDGFEEVQLDGSASTDNDGSIVEYQWKWSIGSATGAQPEVKLPEGQTTIVLKVTDDKGAEAADTVVVTIWPPNQPPAAHAGEDIIIEDKNNDGKENVPLDGSASTRGSSELTSYSWSTSEGEIATGVEPTVSLPVGVTSITLTVTDAKGVTSTDEVKVTVLAYMNTAPVADAGADQVVTDEDGDGQAEVTLDGSKSKDEDGIIEAYSWTYSALDGVIVGVNPTLTLPVGTTEIVLTVTDDRGETGKDTVLITIEAKNEAPVANAGDDREVIDEDGDGLAEVTLDGSASEDPDGSIDSYVWYNSEDKEIAIGQVANVLLPAGVSEIQLVVTDNKGAKDTASVTITVMKPLAIEELPADKDIIKVFPNPANGRVSITSSGYALMESYILNAQGKVLATSKTAKRETTFDVSWYPAGIYFVVTEMGGKQTIRKLIVH